MTTKQRLTYLVLFLLATVFIFLAAKVVFMLLCGDGHTVTAAETAQVLWHGLSLDFSTALYLFVVPFLLCLSAVWVRWPWQRVARAYAWVVAPVMALAFVADTALYPFWGFKLDATGLQYLSTPTEALASVSAAYVLTAVAAWLLLTVAIGGLYMLVTPRPPRRDRYPSPPGQHVFATVPRTAGERWRSFAGSSAQTLAALACAPLIAIGIRGGLSESTTNIGQAYFSHRQFLNHAAVNPVFSFVASLEDTVKDVPCYSFMPDDEARRLLTPYFPALGGSQQRTARHDTLLTTRRPDILLVLIESCGGMFTALEGDTATMPRLNALMREGVNFARCYGNTWRTDRGTLSTWSGYPAFPTYSVMKNPAKSRHLPSIASALVAQGYATHYVYGGDINFTNMRSYLMGTGFQQLTWKTDYTPAEQRTAEWGARDDITCRTVLHLLASGRRDSRQPLLVGYSTLSSHQPWDVPISELPGEERNAFRYVDHCIGQLIDSLRVSPAWQNLLVVLLPDHSIDIGPYHETHPQRNHIPMLWVGGAVRQPVSVGVVCNQSDLAATLLNQLQLPTAAFPFSRDVLSPTYRPMSFHTYNNGFSLTDAAGHFYCHDLSADRAVVSPDGNLAARMERLGKAYLQMASQDLQQR